MAVSPPLSRVLSVQPILGRWFADEGAGPAVTQVILRYGLWQRAFGGAMDAVGRRVLVEGRASREIIGVMPRGFAFPERTDAWVNLAVAGSVKPDQRRLVSYDAVARMAPGVTLQDVRTEFDGAGRPIDALALVWRARRASQRNGASGDAASDWGSPRGEAPRITNARRRAGRR